ncbi:hypothetical protein STIAU_0602 [Stigmatella aurantiaca DW4/3-1]|uniref:Uncharacterized protein n=1 Tax=Stigmatella aurantiaca (strain DW4/3-1) TaxID=378806 RepID=Q096K6_STIAD|nr:hypothetical protein STIAU_0602 [Stigmatella aurantiaca DW4/3-1]
MGALFFRGSLFVTSKLCFKLGNPRAKLRKLSDEIDPCGTE